MRLVQVSESEIHNMDNGVTYRLEENDGHSSLTSVRVIGANVTTTELYSSVGHTICTGADAELFWHWLTKSAEGVK